MQSTRFVAANVLRQQPLIRQRLAAAPMLRAQPTRRMFQTSGKSFMPVPKEEHSAHTISQRLRTLKKIPPELIPLGVVLAAAVFAAVYSLGRKLVVDKTLRLSRTGPKADH